MKKDKSLIVGGLFASVFASACCLGPIIFAGLGFSSLGIINSAETFRPIFIAIALGLLAVAFYVAYFKKPSTECNSDNNCSRPVEKKQKKIVLWSSTVLILATISFPYWSAIGFTDEKFVGKGNFVEKNFYIKGMTCAGCISSVENVLSQEEFGIKDHKVIVGQMVVRFDSDRYRTTKTDCLIAQAVQANTPYRVYLDSNYQTKVCE